MAIPLPQQQQQPVKRQRPSISPWLMGAAALGGGYLADRYGNGGKGMDWLKSKFQPQTATATASPATPKPVVPDAAAGLHQRADAFGSNYESTSNQLQPPAPPVQRIADTTSLAAGTASMATMAPTASKGLGRIVGSGAPGQLGGRLMSMGQQWSPLANKVAPVASKALGVAAPISGALSAANSDAFNGSTGSKILGGTLGAAQGAATAAAFMPAVVGSGPLAPIVATVGIPASMFVDAGLNRYRDNVALQSADQGAADVQMQLMKRYLAALRDPSTASTARESAKRYFNPTMQQSLNDPAQQERYGHNAWLWDKIKPLLSNNAQ